MGTSSGLRQIPARVRRLSSLFLGIAVLNSLLLVEPAFGQSEEPVIAPQASGGSSQLAAFGQAASANLFTGDATLSVPIQVPPGRGQATPVLSLSYASSGGEGAFGLGWNIALGAITRSTRDGTPTCLENNKFTLMLPGATVELVRKAGSQIYYAEVDEAFVESVADPTNNTWTLHDRAGRTYHFGTTPAARSWSGGDVFMDGAGCRFTALWALTQIEDPNGNTIDFIYANTGGNYPYIAEIQYGSNPAAGLNVPPFKIQFRRIPRAYPQESWRLGVRLVFDQLIDRIQVLYRTDISSADFIDRTYTLSYTETPYGGRALLSRIDYDTGLPSRTFTYVDPVVQTIRTETRSIPFAINGSSIELGDGSGFDRVEHVENELMDMNGDGIVDAVYVDPANATAWKVYLGTPTGFSSTPIVWNTQNLPVGEALKRTKQTNGDWTSTTITSHYQTEFATLDITGDGIPDWVDARTTGTWTVYPGRCTSSSQCGFSPGIPWTNAPGMYLASVFSTATHCQNLGNNCGYGSRTLRTLIDLNGDGYLDFVDTSTTPWTWYRGAATGFQAPTAFNGTSGALSIDEPGKTWARTFRWVNNHQYWFDIDEYDSKTVRRVFDYNGDGLPDLVEVEQTPGPCLGSNQIPVPGACNPSALVVSLNTGSGFGTPIRSEGFARWISYQTSDNDTAGGCNLSSEPCNAKVFQDFVDINADGLPDFVSGGYCRGACSPNWTAPADPYVVYNVGAGHLDPAGSRSLPFSVATGSFSTNGAIRVNRHSDWGTSSLTVGVRAEIDLNGDGLFDLVTANGSTQVYEAQLVAPATDPIQPPHLLIAADDGARGLTSFQYTPSTQFDNGGSDGAPDLPIPRWVTTAIRQTDGLCSVTPTNPFDPGNPCLVAGHERLKRFGYQDGLFDAGSREFRGFALVAEIDSNGNETETQFSQADDTRGKILSQIVRAGTYVLRSVTNDWRVNPGRLDPGRNQVYLAETRTEERAVPDSPANRMCSVSRNNYPDAWGRVSTSCTYECGTEPPNPLTSCLSAYIPGESITNTTWAEPASSDSYVRERPSYINSYYVDSAGTLIALALKRMFYDGLAANSVTRGNVTEVGTRRVQSMINLPMDWLNVDMSYDNYGNLTSATDEQGNTTQHVFLPTYFSLHPVQQIRPTVAGVPHVTNIVTDLSLGKPVRITDENAAVSEFAYDALGRPICEASPGDSIAGCHSGGTLSATREFYYTFANPSASTFETRHNRVEVRVKNSASPTGYIAAVSFTDALGRKRFSEVPRTIGTASPTATPSTVVEGQVNYDSEGRTVTQYSPYLAPPIESPSTATAAQTHLTYQLNGTSFIDPLGRVHELDPPDDQYFVSTYLGKRTEVRDTRFAVRATVRDHLGRTIRDESRDRYGVLMISTSYTLDGMGRIVAQVTSDDPSTTVTIGFDTLGRKISGTNPNSDGAWKYAYDNAGNLIYEDDPQNLQHVQMVYDALNRIVRRCTYSTTDAFDTTTSSTSCGAGTTESTYIYDETAGSNNGVGRLTTATDADGSSERFWYDARGRVFQQQRTIQSITASTAFAYDSADRIQTITYPDNEVVHYGFNAAGQLISIEGVVDDVDYDFMGRTITIVRSNGTTDTRAYFGGANNFRLRDLQTYLTSNSSAKYLDLSYTYNTVGKVQDVTDHRDALPSPLSDAATYNYDDVGRLESVTDSALNDNFGFDAKGNLTARSSKILSYSSTIHPNQATSFGSAGMAYTANGNRAQKSEAGGTEFYYYNALDQLKQIDAAGSVVTYGYGYNGRHLWRKTNGAEMIRYFSKFAESQQGGVLTKHYWAGDVLIASRHVSGPQYSSIGTRFYFPIEWQIAFWSSVVALLLGAGLQMKPLRLRLPNGALAARSLGAVFLLLLTGPAVLLLSRPAEACGGGSPPLPYSGVRHYHTDHLGSTQVVTGDAGGLTEQIRYDAYGVVRKRANPGGADVGGTNDIRREFTGYEAEHVSGLEYAGARFYDPELGQFLIHDPAGQFPNPYTYCGWDPMNGTDPTGAFTGFEWALIIVAIGLATTSAVQAYQTGGWNAAAGSLIMSVVTIGIGWGVGSAVGVAGSSVGIASSVGSLASHPLVQWGLLAASTGLSAAGLAEGGQSSGLAYASYALAGVSLGLAFASASSQAANGVVPEGNIKTGNNFPGGSEKQCIGPNICAGGSRGFVERTMEGWGHILSTEEGRQAYLDIVGTHYQVTISEAEGGNWTDFAVEADAMNHVGTDATIHYDPNLVDAPYVGPRPPDVGLFHEVLHARLGVLGYHPGIDGSLISGHAMIIGEPGGYGLTENAYRRDRGVPPRQY